MKRIQKVLFALAAVVALGLWGANSALADTQLTTQGGLRSVRLHSHNDVVSAITLINQGGAPGTIVAGTTITITFAGDVTNGFDSRVFVAPLTSIADGDFSPEDLVVCTGAGGGAACDSTNLTEEYVVTVDGSDFIISFVAPVIFATGEGLTLSGVRMDIAAAGEGDISATISSSGDPVGNRVTYSNPVVLVARSRDELDIEIEPAEDNFLLCDPAEVPNLPQYEFTATVKELWGAVYTTDIQEAASGHPLELPGAVDGSRVVFTLSGVNAELTVRAALFGIDAGLVPVIDDNDQTSDGDDLEFNVNFTTDNLSTTEEFSIRFTVFLDTGDDLDMDISTVNLAVALGPLGDFDEDDPEILLFADNGVNADVLQIVECLSFLLYHWVPNTGDGAYDTGMTMSNTGNAPDELRTPAAQTGPCHVHFYELDGGDEVAVVDTPDLAPGETATMVVSQALAEPFLGYAIAVCEFQWGHGYWFTNSPSPGTGGAFAQGASATVLTDRTGKSEESQGQ